jgi:hypothetical protein
LRLVPDKRRRFHCGLPILLSLVSAFACSSSASRGVSGQPTPAASPVASSDRAADGSSLDKAIVVPRDTEKEGIAWEYAWIREHFGEHRRKGQSLLMGDGGRRFDQVTVQLANGSERTFYFDITRYFGHH